ncbi:MAG: class I SAM-dependent methyltransferase [Methanobrevibacter sp.]|jgi:ubiquinone/menaquinone biosynthesis C-methylase UbiE|nr:class I SAM-dependent methyltransferase [Candidatus Methanovirga procula]
MNFSIDEIDKLNYNQLIGIVEETNRPPGGIKTILHFINYSNIKNNSKILEIGTSTGFTAIEIAKRIDCEIVAIDINKDSLKIAEDRAKKYDVHDKIKFSQENAMNLSFEDEEFNFVFSGNILSYIPEREKALKEYMRVLKPGGVLFAVPMYYKKIPSDVFFEKICNALKMEITVDTENYWNNFFNVKSLDKFLAEKYEFDYIKNKEIQNFVDEIFEYHNNEIKKK